MQVPDTARLGRNRLWAGTAAPVMDGSPTVSMLSLSATPDGRVLAGSIGGGALILEPAG